MGPRTSEDILQQRIRQRDELLIAADLCEEAGLSLAAQALRERSLNLQLFCADDPASQPEFTHPFVLSGVKYATDRRVIVAIRTDEEDSPIRRREFPTNAFDALPQTVGRWRPWPPRERVTHDYYEELQPVGSVHIVAELDDKIRTLPKLEWAATVSAHCIAFQFSGGEGRVAGVRFPGQPRQFSV